MERDSRDDRLTRISTQWSIVFQAHSDNPEDVSKAQAELMTRYAGAIHRYLLAALRDVHAAEELDQEFAVRFLRGDFHRADPSRGRFRDFVKRSLRNLMIDYQRRLKNRPRTLGDHVPDSPEPGAPAEFEQAFTESWRKDLLSRAWSSLEEFQKQTGRPYFTVLQRRAEMQEATSQELAESLSKTLDKPLNAGWVRQNLLRARERFVEFLIEEVAASLPHPGLEEIESELADLDLLHYCAPILRRRREEHPSDS